MNIIDKLKRCRRYKIMMKDGNYFDSKKAKKIAEYTQYAKDYELYLTDNGVWITVKERYWATKLDSEAVKEILIDLNDVDNYEKYFKKLTCV